MEEVGREGGREVVGEVGGREGGREEGVGGERAEWNLICVTDVWALLVRAGLE